MAAKKIAISKEDREKVKVLAGYGVPHPAIADIIGIAQRTLERRCAEELRVGFSQANAKIAQALFISATVDRVPSTLIFLGKTRLHLREVAAVELTGPNGERLLQPDVPSLTIIQENLALAHHPTADLERELARRAAQGLAAVH